MSWSFPGYQRIRLGGWRVLLRKQRSMESLGIIMGIRSLAWRFPNGLFFQTFWDVIKSDLMVVF